MYFVDGGGELVSRTVKAKFLNGVATGKAMAAGMSPDLGGEVATKNQYM